MHYFKSKVNSNALRLQRTRVQARLWHYLVLLSLTVLLLGCEAELGQGKHQSVAHIEPLAIDYDPNAVVAHNLAPAQEHDPADEVDPVHEHEGHDDYEQAGQLSVEATLDLSLDPELSKAIMHGVPLTFVYEVQLSQPSRFFFDRELAYRAQQWRIHYHPLLQQLTVDDGRRVSQEFSLGDSLRHIQGRQRIQLPLTQPLDASQEYTVAMRLRLDTAHLPGAFKFDLFNFRSVWSLSSQWQRITFRPPAP